MDSWGMKMHSVVLLLVFSSILLVLYFHSQTSCCKAIIKVMFFDLHRNAVLHFDIQMSSTIEDCPACCLYSVWLRYNFVDLVEILYRNLVNFTLIWQARHCPSDPIIGTTKSVSHRGLYWCATTWEHIVAGLKKAVLANFNLKIVAHLYCISCAVYFVSAQWVIFLTCMTKIQCLQAPFFLSYL